MKKKIVHIGLGAFFRAHQAWYTQNVDPEQQWEIIAYTGRSEQAANQLNEQGCKYTLIERGPATDGFTEIQAITRAVPGNDVPDLIQTLSDPAVAIVTLTITESGYVPDQSHPLEHSALGRLVLALEARHKNGAAPIALVPCDNLPSNGESLRASLMTLGNHLGADFLDYLSNKVSFVSSSVDRITPKTTQADVELVQKMGFADSMPVVTEPFTDWVLSGEFPNGRPDWERAGARFVAEIEPYERRKLWFLNGAHSILALVGLARGHTTVFDAIQDTFCKDLVNQWWNDAEKVLDNSELQLDDYKQKLVSRFENRRIEHLLSQIASDSSLKLNVRFTHVVEGLRQQGQISTSAAMVFAFWIDLCLNQQLPTDANHEAITLASQSDEPITQLLKVVSANLAEDLEFVQAITSALEKIQAKNIANIESSTALVE